jgi:UDP-N-acetylmuramoylalanine--D-glutamate ligase
MMPVLKQAFLSIHTEQASVIPKHFLVLGLGESGLAMVNWCLQHGATVDLADTRSHAGLSNQQQETLETLKESGLSQLH